MSPPGRSSGGFSQKLPTGPRTGGIHPEKRARFRAAGQPLLPHGTWTKKGDSTVPPQSGTGPGAGLEGGGQTAGDSVAAGGDSGRDSSRPEEFHGGHTAGPGSRVLQPVDLGEFSILQRGTVVRTLFLPLAQVQRAMEQERRVNALLLSAGRGGSREEGDLLRCLLRETLTPDDAGVRASPPKSRHKTYVRA